MTDGSRCTSNGSFAILVALTATACGELSLGSTSRDQRPDRGAANATPNSSGAPAATGGTLGGTAGKGGVTATNPGGAAGYVQEPIVASGGEGGFPSAPFCGVVNDSPRDVDCGDVNRDHVIDITDALLVSQYAQQAGVTIWVEAADVNCDGTIDDDDANMISSYYVGSISEFPCPAYDPTST